MDIKPSYSGIVPFPFRATSQICEEGVWFGPLQSDEKLVTGQIDRAIADIGQLLTRHSEQKGQKINATICSFKLSDPVKFGFHPICFVLLEGQQEAFDAQKLDFNTFPAENLWLNITGSTVTKVFADNKKTPARAVVKSQAAIEHPWRPGIDLLSVAKLNSDKATRKLVTDFFGYAIRLYKHLSQEGINLSAAPKKANTSRSSRLPRLTEL